MAKRKAPPDPPARPEVLALLAEAKRHPEDDGPRLVLADWLDEHNDPRGEFIRIQLEKKRFDPLFDVLGGGAYSHPRVKALCARERELFGRHLSSWREPYRVWGGKWAFQRGLFSIAPNSTRFFKVCWADFRGTESLAWVQHLILWGLTDQDTTTLASCPLWPELVGVDLVLMPPDNPDLRPLFAAPAPFLRRLSLCTRESSHGALGTLLDSPLARQLIELDGVTLTLRAGDLERLAGTAALSGLRRLRLGLHAVTEGEAHALAGSGYLERLELLTFLAGRVSAKALAALLGGPRLTRLHTLHLSTGLSGAAIEVLRGARPRRHLRDLGLGYNDLNERAAERLAGADLLGTLEVLKLVGNRIGDRGAVALAESPHLAGLKTLDLCSNQIGNRGAQALAASEVLAGLEILHVGYNKIGPEARRALRQRFRDRVYGLRDQRG